ncbi:MFS transporter [Microlunatus soli]|uniref:MFS transporter, DHA1 family, chloramphenicol resistance protein n=1 Tax=Microlunatus soli TaxID=630515 RepID=A0A1H1SWX1_9ACTN|nr:MFS transporter [Microlunatus soli]SDS52323.1 MFS transporter, DHA1 family, chloramphenicol resistance protein [Microlunatus soli]
MTTTASAAPRVRTRPPLAVYVLGAAIFAQGTSEFMIAGLLPDLTSDLEISVPQAGMLITAFAVGMAIGAPLMTVATLRLPRKLTLIAAAIGYLLLHLVGLFVHNYPALMITRVISAVLYATFWAVSAVVASRLAGPAVMARALAILVGGLSVANVLGVPAGTWLGEHFGWRAAFLAVAVATAASVVSIVILVPDTDSRTTVIRPMRQLITEEVQAFRRGRLWLALLTTALFQGAIFAAFSYFSPLLINITGVSADRAPLYLLIFGVGAFVGTTLGGRVADRGPLANVMISLGATVLASLLLLAVVGSAVGVAIAIGLYSLAAFSIAGALNARVFGFAGSAPTLAAAVNTSAFNVGNAVGPALGGLAIAGGLGFRSPVLVGVAMLVAALAVATVSAVVERRPDRDESAPELDPAATPAATAVCDG